MGTGRSPTWPFQKSWSGPHREGEESKPMKHGQEKSDLFIIALKPTNKPGRLGRSWWSQGRGPRETWESNTRTGHCAGLNVPQRLDCVREAGREMRTYTLQSHMHFLCHPLLAPTRRHHPT